MDRKITPCLFLLPFVFLLTMGFSMANTVIVRDANALVLNLPQLEDGDTLSLSAGSFIITPALAPDGLLITSSDWSPYKDLTILGSGIDSTIIDFSDSYGLFAYYSENLLIKNLSIKNATKNGGIYVQSGEVNLENVRVENCQNVAFGTKTEAHGGAVFYDANSSFTSIKSCVFVNNYAQNNGGAIAFMNMTNLYPKKSYIEDCEFRNNTSSTGASAVYLRKIFSYFYLNRNVFYRNSNASAIYVNATNSKNARLYLKNNSIALNADGGLSIGTTLRSYLFLDNNVIINNGGYDIKRSSSSTLYTGNFNVAGLANKSAFSGYFNNVLTDNALLFKVESDSLKHTSAAANYLAGRVSADAMFSYDMYGDTCFSPGDIGAVNVKQGQELAIWTGAENQDFYNANNWRNGVFPQGDGIPSVVRKTIISECSLANYPIISEAITLANGGDLSQTDLCITPTGIFKNQGEISLDTLLVESQNGGTGQLINQGNIINNKRLAEHYIVAGKWTPIYVPDDAMTVDQLISSAVYTVDYEVQSMNESSGNLVEVPSGVLLDQNRGYLVKSIQPQKAVFETSDTFNEYFSLQHTFQDDTVSSGWNMIGNPYGATVVAEELLANAGNNLAATGALYTYDGTRFKVWVDGIGDEEAELIDAHEAFFVKALDIDKASPVDDPGFKLDTSNLMLVENSALRSSDNQREGSLTIGLATTNNMIYDRTFLRFKDDATMLYDNRYDAYKVGRLEGVNSSIIHTNNIDEGEVNYAVNTQALAAGGVLSIPVHVDFLQLSLSRSQNRRLRFFTSGGESISYLFHDALKDSSKSVALTNGKIISFTTQTDSVALFNRFSLQVFDGEIPDEVIASSSRKTGSVTEMITNKPDTLIHMDTLSFLEYVDTLKDNPDTTFVLEYWLDSINVQSYFVNATHTDSIFYDTTFMDTTRLWGTYEFVETDTLVSTLFKRYTEYADTVLRSTFEINEYVIYDTLLVTGTNSVKSPSDWVRIYTVNQYIYIDSKYSNVNVRVYNLSGNEVKRVNLSQGSGKIEMMKSGIFIVRIEQEDRLVSRKILIN